MEITANKSFSALCCLCMLLPLVPLCSVAQSIERTAGAIQYYRISDSITYGYEKPGFFDMIKFIPGDIAEFGLNSIQPGNIAWSGAALGATLLLIPIDQQLVDASIQLGSNFNFDAGHSYGNIGPLRVIPNDINSAVYYIGNGGTTLLLSGFFYTLGSIKSDYRALNTSSELVEVLLSVGVITQAIKRMSGRQSPGPAMESGHPGGHWRPFPGIGEYQRRTSNYDAMPSGHLATFMATITVIAANYPEIKWIKPVGYGLMGIMAFEMMSSKVHWASDYPLALLIGYGIGTLASKRRIQRQNQVEKQNPTVHHPVPTISVNRLDQVLVLGVRFRF